MATIASRGKMLWDILREALRDYRLGPVAGDRTRPVIHGVNARGELVDGMTLDGFLAQAGRILKDSGRIYAFEDTVCYETDPADHPQLILLATQGKAETNAVGNLANLFAVGAGDRQSLPASKLVGALLADEDLRRRLPVIRHYARRPIFDAEFNLCRPGWNPDSGILVHGPEIVPTPPPAHASDAGVLDRLPPRLRGLLREFCWRSDADLANALGVLLTGLLVNHFVDDPHPVVAVDANQSGLGKTLLVEAFGRILDDVVPKRIALVRDEELEKKLCAQLCDGRSSVIFLDNVRGTIESALIEQNSLSPVLSFRILGRSATITRPNAYLWAVTGNGTTGTTDYVRRGVPIRLFYEGDPKGRKFAGKPLDYVARHRLEILGELAGMVVRWVERGRPLVAKEHRCDAWAATIGGILDAVGLGGPFLGNVAEAEEQMDQDLQSLAALAEHVAVRGPEHAHAAGADDPASKGMPAADWTAVFSASEAHHHTLADRSPKGKATWIGNYLGAKVGRRVSVAIGEAVGVATLRVRAAKARQKLYYFEIATAEPSGRPESTPAESGASPSPPPDPTGAGGAAGLSEDPQTSTEPSPASDGPRPDGQDTPGGGDQEWV